MLERLISVRLFCTSGEVVVLCLYHKTFVSINFYKILKVPSSQLNDLACTDKDETSKSIQVTG